MSEVLHSREYRQQQLQEIIRDLHRGATVEEVQARFHTLIKDIGPGEIANLEQALIQEGMPEQEIKRLCDVHVAVFRQSLDKQQVQAEEVPGHPIHTFRQENAAISGLVIKLERLLGSLQTEGSTDEADWQRWQELHRDLLQIEKHYSRKENVLFPYLEHYGISGPPGVMWSIHDEIRAQLKTVSKQLADDRPEAAAAKRLISETALPMLNAIKEMVYKEEKILFPMSLDLLTEQEWGRVRTASEEIGYAFVQPADEWQPAAPDTATEPVESRTSAGTIPLDVGALTVMQLNQMLTALPIDVTFVDENNVVRYYSQSKERIFTRTPAIIGRQVGKCHPPESVHVVENIVQDFRTKRRDSADFWIEMGGKLIYIRYFPVRDKAGKYLGVLEVTQDVTGIRALQGQKRLLDEPAE